MINVNRVAIKWNPEPSKISPKLVEFSRWKFIEEVNAQLDDGTSPNSVHAWVIERGFKISPPLLYDYAKLRKKALIDGVSMEHVLGILGNPMLDRLSPEFQSTKDKLKSEIDALDLIIQRGYKNIRSDPKADIGARELMAAIKLKNDLTDGNHGFLTNFGMEHLRDIENAKYSLIIEHLISYIPEKKRPEAIAKIADIEDNYYQKTDYYEEYLRANGELTEEQIQQKLELYKINRKTLQTVV